MKKENFSIKLKSNVDEQVFLINSGELISIGASVTTGLDDFIKSILIQIPNEIESHFISTKRDVKALLNISDALTFSYSPNLSFSEFLIELIEQIVLNNKRFIIIEGIDYINVSENSILFYTVKTIATKYDVIIILTVKISKQCEKRGGDKKPRISDIKTSNTLIDLSDKIMLAYRYDRFGFTYDEFGDSTINRLDVQIVKNNEGQINTFLYKI